MRLHRCEGYVKALFRLSALLVNSTGGIGSGTHSTGGHQWVHRDPRFLHLIDRLDAQSQTPAGFSSQSYSKMLTAFAHLDYLPPLPFLNRLRDGMQARMEAQPDFLDPYSMSHVISAFVNLNLYHPGDAFLALYTEVSRLTTRAARLLAGSVCPVLPSPPVSVAAAHLVLSTSKTPGGGQPAHGLPPRRPHVVDPGLRQARLRPRPAVSQGTPTRTPDFYYTPNRRTLC